MQGTGHRLSIGHTQSTPAKQNENMLRGEFIELAVTKA
ncbi:hypothetical protein CPter291_2468 [Collimonas pratensis]|uniref:Uncharacterized protein n=1 Tax=Collimonas pratensis TaxID=279113 RepID=A0ABM5Z6G6_9BURK|nr:hypothetical protein CPter291_2468 [Collimonas pratensis]